MVEDGVLGLRSGERSIRFRPPINLTRDHTDEGLELLSKSINRLS